MLDILIAFLTDLLNDLDKDRASRIYLHEIQQISLRIANYNSSMTSWEWCNSWWRCWSSRSPGTSSPQSLHFIIFFISSIQTWNLQLNSERVKFRFAGVRLLLNLSLYDWAGLRGCRKQMQGEEWFGWKNLSYILKISLKLKKFASMNIKYEMLWSLYNIV